MLKKHNTMIRRTVDVCMTALLLCLMAYQVTGETLHEWIGIGMTVLVILHQILNRKWYGAMFKGKYKSYRMITTVISVLLIISFALTAFCGMAMSGHAVPFMYGMVKVSFARSMHLSMSHWSFVLMGLHLGLHIPVMFAKLSIADKIKTAISVVFCIIAGTGLFLFIKNGVPDYLFFQVPFASLDYEKSGILVFLENILQLTFWGYIGTETAVLCRNSQRKKEEKKNPLLPVVLIMGAVLLGVIIHMLAGNRDKKGSAGAGWSSFGKTVKTSSSEKTDKTEKTESTTESRAGQTAEPSAKADPAKVQDGFILVGSGTFLMGSPESENWRIDDEVQHEVNVSAFYIDPYETTQEDIQAWLDVNGIAR